MEWVKEALRGFKDGWRDSLNEPSVWDRPAAVWAVRAVFLAALVVVLLRK